MYHNGLQVELLAHKNVTKYFLVQIDPIDDSYQKCQNFMSGFHESYM